MRLPGPRPNRGIFVAFAQRPPPSKLLSQVARAPRTKVICAPSVHAKSNTTFPKVLFPSERRRSWELASAPGPSPCFRIYTFKLRHSSPANLSGNFFPPLLVLTCKHRPSAGQEAFRHVQP